VEGLHVASTIGVDTLKNIELCSFNIFIHFSIVLLQKFIDSMVQNRVTETALYGAEGCSDISLAEAPVDSFRDVAR
jgi:hypothetical protein